MQTGDARLVLVVAESTARLSVAPREAGDETSARQLEGASAVSSDCAPCHHKPAAAWRASRSGELDGVHVPAFDAAVRDGSDDSIASPPPREVSTQRLDAFTRARCDEATPKARHILARVARRWCAPRVEEMERRPHRSCEVQGRGQLPAAERMQTSSEHMARSHLVSARPHAQAIAGLPRKPRITRNTPCAQQLDCDIPQRITLGCCASSVGAARRAQIADSVARVCGSCSLWALDGYSEGCTAAARSGCMGAARREARAELLDLPHRRPFGSAAHPGARDRRVLPPGHPTGAQRLDGTHGSAGTGAPNAHLSHLGVARDWQPASLSQLASSSSRARAAPIVAAWLPRELGTHDVASGAEQLDGHAVECDA